MAYHHQLRLNLTPVNGASSQLAWKYLLSEQVSFEKGVSNCIRIKKPSDDILAIWIEKLANSGCCDTIFVENLQQTQIFSSSLLSLCSKNGVSIFNLSVDAVNHSIRVENLVA